MNKSILKIAQTIWSKSCGPRIKMTIRIFVADKRNRHILERLKGQTQIKIIFFTMNLGMWKYDNLFKLLLLDKHFSPYVVSLLNPDENMSIQIATQRKMKKAFEDKGFPFIECYNELKGEWFDMKKFKPDIIFYAQPYNKGYKGYLMEQFERQSLFFYIPYTFMMEHSGMFFNTALHNLSYKLFYPTKMHKQLAQQKAFNKGTNVVVTGHPLLDYIYPGAPVKNNPWKKTSKDIKKIIWAPHHSILQDDTLNYSNFLQIADDMLSLAHQFKDSVQFAFKPHPGLKTKLYGLKEWGQKRTDEYFKKWGDLPNTILVDGEYEDLFNSSDAMIHDCSSFSGEYLFTLKPVMYLSKADHLDYMNEFGVACFECHYKGKTINDVCSFIKEVVIGGKDPMQSKRETFYKSQLKPQKSFNVARNMYNELCKLYK